MNFKGTVYIFDLDDTLYWTSDWYETARLNRDGYIYQPGESGNLKNALELFTQLNAREDIPERLMTLQLKTQKKHQLDGRDIYFEVTDKAGAPVPLEELQAHITPEQLSAAGIRVNRNFSPFAIITNDDQYYLNPNTIGRHGPNSEMLELYEANHQNAIILTARKSGPGMQERIAEILSDHPPMEIVTQPLDSPNSGRYKGNYILSVAMQPEVTQVYFYDDNSKYIKRVDEVLSAYDEEHGTNLRAKVDINVVSTEGKPMNKLKLAHAYSSILGRDHYLRKNGFADKYINELYDE
jgi:hypothetical protein